MIERIKARRLNPDQRVPVGIGATENDEAFDPGRNRRTSPWFR
jgi:hypothetical protein